MSPWLPLNPDKDEIRLMILHPSSRFDDELFINLETVSLRDEPQYEAISYAWGAPDDKVTIRFEDSCCKIATSLDSCLRHLRYAKESRTLWADALCIDQRTEHNSIEERNSQVFLMSTIFGKANVVRVWTGVPENGSTAMQILRHMLQDQYLLDIKIGGALLGKRDLDSLTTFLCNAWWHRVWTQQEIALARMCVIHYGHEFVDRDIVRCIIANIKHLEAHSSGAEARFGRPAYEDHFKAFDKLRATKVALQQDGNLRTFNDLLSRSRQLLCSDKRDRIYGLIGLAPVSLRQRVKPNYFKSMEWIYQDFALEFILVDGQLSIFANIKYDPGRSMPSWVLDWSKMVTRNRTIDHLFSACGSTPLRSQLIGLTTLKLAGTQIDTVARKMDKQGFGGRNAGSRKFPSRYQEWKAFYGRTERYRNAEDACWRTLSHDLFVRRGASIILRIESDFSLSARRAAEGVRDQEIEDFLYSVNLGSGNSALFVTENGYFGMGCAEVQASDKVYVLAGGQLC
jgi:hypothetical protein